MTCMHVIPDSQRRAVERVAGVLFSDVLKLEPDPNEPGGINQRCGCQLRRMSGGSPGTRTPNPLIKSQLLYH
jgi:hypothetical protein